MTQTRRLHPEWRDSYELTPYPFTDFVTLRNADGVFLPDDTFLDATLYPIGGGVRMRMSKVTVTHEDVTVYIGDETNDELASGEFNILTPPSNVRLEDTYGRPAGLLVSEPDRLAIFQSWTAGTHEFTQEQTGFAAVCCIPTPEIALRGFILDDGSVMTGDVWLIGDDGIALTPETQPGRLLSSKLVRTLEHSLPTEDVQWNFQIQLTDLVDASFLTPIIDEDTTVDVTQWTFKLSNESSFSSVPIAGVDTKLSRDGVNAATMCYQMTAAQQLLVQPGSTYRLRKRQLPTGGDYTAWIDNIFTVPASDCLGRDLLSKTVIRVDVVGDPLFRRRICENIFFTPRFLRTITFQKDCRKVVCGPDPDGDIKITVGHQDSPDTILRVRSTDAGLIIEAVGETLETTRSIIDG